MPKGRPRKFKSLRPGELKEALSQLRKHAPDVFNLAGFLAVSVWRIRDAIDLRWKEVIWETQEIDREHIKTSDGLTYLITYQIEKCLDYERNRLKTQPAMDDYVCLDAGLKPWSYNIVYRCITGKLERTSFYWHVSPHV